MGLTDLRSRQTDYTTEAEESPWILAKPPLARGKKGTTSVDDVIFTGLRSKPNKRGPQYFPVTIKN